MFHVHEQGSLRGHEARVHMHSRVHLVFTQSDATTLPTEQLTTHARRFFGGGFEVTGDSGLRLSAHGASALFSVTSREVTEPDLAAADRAEFRGKAAGMAALARRCPRLWTVESGEDAPPWLVLECCALLASVTLGPILPPDESTLLGVRSARDLAERLRILA